jgi:hypothetical protein
MEFFIIIHLKQFQLDGSYGRLYSWEVLDSSCSEVRL